MGDDIVVINAAVDGLKVASFQQRQSRHSEMTFTKSVAVAGKK
jgi:hypothetical protein